MPRDMYPNDVIDFAIAHAHSLNLHVRQIEGVNAKVFYSNHFTYNTYHDFILTKRKTTCCRL